MHHLTCCIYLNIKIENKYEDYFFSLIIFPNDIFQRAFPYIKSKKEGRRDRNKSLNNDLYLHSSFSFSLDLSFITMSFLMSEKLNQYKVYEVSQLKCQIFICEINYRQD
jgi:hypothetical protein